VDIGNVALGYSESLDLGIANEFISQQGSEFLGEGNAISTRLKI
jgi:hypothetical protein